MLLLERWTRGEATGVLDLGGQAVLPEEETLGVMRRGISSGLAGLTTEVLGELTDSGV